MNRQVNAKKIKSPREGSLASMAEKANMSVSAFAKANVHDTGRLGKLVRLYYTQQGVHGDGKSNMQHPGDKRDSSTRVYQVG